MSYRVVGWLGVLSAAVAWSTVTRAECTRGSNPYQDLRDRTFSISAELTTAAHLEESKGAPLGTRGRAARLVRQARSELMQLEKESAAAKPGLPPELTRRLRTIAQSLVADPGYPPLAARIYQTVKELDAVADSFTCPPGGRRD